MDPHDLVAAEDRHHDLLAEARRKIDRGEPLDEITHHRLVQKNNEALADLRSILAPPPRLPPGLQVFGPNRAG